MESLRVPQDHALQKSYWVVFLEVLRRAWLTGGPLILGQTVGGQGVPDKAGKGMLDKLGSKNTVTLVWVHGQLGIEVIDKLTHQPERA